MKFSKRMVVGNWKMNPLAVKDAEGLLVELTKNIKSISTFETAVMVAPPAPFLLAVQKKAEKAGVQLVAQTMSGEIVGPFTGEISAKQLKSVGVGAVIVGHSERRAAGMTNAQVNTIVLQALKEKMTPIVCVGEVARDNVGDFYSYIETQLKAALAGVVKSKLGEVVLAYEPVWAIGTGKTATPDDVLEIKLYIQKVLITLYDRSVVPKVRILYGGSVNAKNTLELLERAEVDGFLVGGASLQPKEFSSIIMTVEKYVRK